MFCKYPSVIHLVLAKAGYAKHSAFDETLDASRPISHVL